MRIIAGDAKGRRILSPEGKDTRPTSDKVKESMFNILGSKVPDSKVLDLYAGTGNLALEAISRGAQSAVLIDRSRESIKIIHQNIKLLNYGEYCEVYNNDAIPALNILHRRGLSFDIIFLDPPYHKNILPEVIETIWSLNLLKSTGIIVAEHDTRDVLPDNIKDFVMVKKALYGDTRLSFYVLMKSLEE